MTARCLSYDKFLEDNNDDNKKGFEPFHESNVEDIVLLKIKLERLIEKLENINKEYASIIRLLYEGYDKAEIIKQLDIYIKEGLKHMHSSKKAQQCAKKILEEDN